MKQLYLVRHAKSSWEYDVPDYERPLKTRGINDANLVSNHLKPIIELPDLVITSHAVRAETTARIFITNLGIDEQFVTVDHDVYDFSGYNLVEVIKSCPNTIQTLMVFGHNHAFTWFVNTYGNTPIDNVPTSGFTHIEFNITHWQNLKQGVTKQTVFPKQLKA